MERLLAHERACDPKVQQEDDPSSASSSEDEESSDPEPTHEPSGSGLPCGSRGQSGGPGRCAEPSGRPHLTASSDSSSSAASETHGGPGKAPDPRDSEGSGAHGHSRVHCDQPSPVSSDELPSSIPRRPRKASHTSKSGIERGASRPTRTTRQRRVSNPAPVNLRVQTRGRVSGKHPRLVRRRDQPRSRSTSPTGRGSQAPPTATCGATGRRGLQPPPCQSLTFLLPL